MNRKVSRLCEAKKATLGRALSILRRPPIGDGQFLRQHASLVVSPWRSVISASSRFPTVSSTCACLQAIVARP